MTAARDFPGATFRYLANSLMKDFSLLYSSRVTSLDESKMKMISAMISVSGPAEIKRYSLVNMRYSIAFKK